MLNTSSFSVQFIEFDTVVVIDHIWPSASTWLRKTKREQTSCEACSQAIVSLEGLTKAFYVHYWKNKLKEMLTCGPERPLWQQTWPVPSMAMSLGLSRASSWHLPFPERKEIHTSAIWLSSHVSSASSFFSHICKRVLMWFRSTACNFRTREMRRDL